MGLISHLPARLDAFLLEEGGDGGVRLPASSLGLLYVRARGRIRRQQPKRPEAHLEGLPARVAGDLSSRGRRDLPLDAPGGQLSDGVRTGDLQTGRRRRAVLHQDRPAPEDRRRRPGVRFTEETGRSERGVLRPRFACRTAGSLFTLPGAAHAGRGGLWNCRGRGHGQWQTGSGPGPRGSAGGRAALRRCVLQRPWRRGVGTSVDAV